MSLLLTGLGSFYALWLPVVFLTFALITLESERAWARMRRGRGLQPGPVAYLLDGLMIIGVLLAIVSAIALLVSGGMAALALIGTGFDWVGRQVSAHPLLAGLIVVCIAVLAGIALTLRRGTSRSSAATWPAGGYGGAEPLGTSPAGAPTAAPVPAMADTSERRSIYVPVAQESFAEEPLPSLTMLQTRQRPAAAPIPKSFLELGAPKPEPSATTGGGRSALVPALLMLAVVVILISGALLFRQQIVAALSGRSVSLVVDQPGGQTTGADVGVAAVPSSSQASVQPQAQPTPAPTAAIAGAAPAETRHVKSDTLNVRAAPGLDQEVVIVLAKGDAVTLMQETRVIRDTTWVRVRVGDREGWVSQTFLE